MITVPPTDPQWWQQALAWCRADPDNRCIAIVENGHFATTRGYLTRVIYRGRVKGIVVPKSAS